MIFMGRLHDGVLDEISTFVQRVLASIPEFVIGLALVALFSTSVFKALPAVSTIPPGSRPWSNLDAVWLPALLAGFETTD